METISTKEALKTFRNYPLTYFSNQGVFSFCTK